MLHLMKKAFFLSLLLSVATGLTTYYLFNLPLDQSIALSFIAGVIFFLFIHSSKQESTVVEKVVNPSESNDEYRLLEKKFKAISEKADKLEIEKKTTELFLASMSHEIRTPLNGIIGLTEVLDETPLAKDQKEFVSMIRESSNNLRVIVNDILDVSKINAGKMELESIDFDLFTKVESSVGVFTPKIDEKGIQLNLYTDPKIPRHVMGDPTRLSQVIINLVSNALKFTDTGGQITISTDFIEQNDDRVSFKISVTDSGIGLTEEQQEKIFEAYSQAEASTARKAGGTGLGLTISSKIIQSMGGTLEVKSELGKGATFFFVLTLPVSENRAKETYLDYSGVSVGVVLSDAHENDQCDSILKKYVENYDAAYARYDKKEIFSSASDLVLIDHQSVDEEMLEKLSELSATRVLLTSSAQQTALDKERKIFDEVVYMPVTLERIADLLQITKGYSGIPEIREEEELSKALGKEALKEEVPAEEESSSEKYHVLVAEDNPINQKLIKIVLEKLGLEVTLVDNGEKALQARIDGKYDMIFMDIQMPVMGGVESTHSILAYEKDKGLEHTPIIALTANALPGDREKYIAEGMDDYATKPLDVKVLEGLIAHYCV